MAARNLYVVTIPVLTLAIMTMATAAAVAQTAPAPPPLSAAPAAGMDALSFDIASIRRNNTSTDGRHHIYNDPGESHFPHRQSLHQGPDPVRV